VHVCTEYSSWPVANQKGYDGVHTAIFAREKYWQIVTTTSEFELKMHKSVWRPNLQRELMRSPRQNMDGTGSHFVTQRPSDPGIQRPGDPVDPVTLFYSA